MSAVFIGCVESSKELLTEILFHKVYPVVGIVTKESSNANSDFCDLTEIANVHKIPVFYYKGKNSDKEMIEWISNLNPEVIFCFGWSHLLPLELIEMPPAGVIGFHPTALPANRGRHPIIWTLVLGLESTASTFFKIEEGADTGAIVSQKNIVVDISDDATTLYRKILDIAKKQIHEIGYGLLHKSLKVTPQNSELANTWRKRGEADGRIDWRMTSMAIYNLVRGLTRPYPGATFTFGSQTIVVWKSRIIADSSARFRTIEPGKIMQVHGNSFTVKTGDGEIEILQYEGNFVPEVGVYL